MKSLTTFCLLTLGCLLLPVSVFAASFGDVPGGAYYQQAVTWAVSKGVTDGFPDGTFRPDATCTRGQVVTFLWRANGKPEPETTANPFSDINPASAFYKAILWACERKITKGTSATTFNPSASCTYGQIVTFIWRANGRPSADADSTLTADYAPGAYYADAVAWADNLGLLGGTGKAFKPGDICPRADVVTYLYRNADDGAPNRSKAYTPDYDKWESNYNANGTSTLDKDEQCLKIENPVPNHAMITQVVPVKPDTDYKFTAVFCVKDYQPGKENSGGACINVADAELTVYGGMPEYVTSGDVWTTLSTVFNSGSATSVCLCLSNGWYAAASAGTACFKEMTLEEQGTNEAQPLL